MHAGVARVAAAVVGGRTALVDAAHCYPSRVFPSTPPSAAAVGAAGVIVSEHGGGLLGGDHYRVELAVGDHATLLIQSQAATNVFQTRPATQHRSTQLSSHLTVGSGGLAVLAPNCMVPFKDSQLETTLEVTLDNADSSVIVVDPISAGRVQSGERWELTRFAQRATFHRRNPDPTPLLNTALELRCGDASRMLDFAGVPHDAFATIVALGPRAAEVIAHAESVRREHLSAQFSPRAGGGRPGVVPQWSLSVTHLNPTDAGARDVGASGDGDGTPGAVIRVVAREVEQLYCSLQTLLAPLEPSLGVAPYGSHGLFHTSAGDSSVGRAVGAAPTPPLPTPPLAPAHSSGGADSAEPAITGANFEGIDSQASVERAPSSTRSRWHLAQLTDATLPTGGFAHSAGLEAAAQYGYLPTETAVNHFVVAALQHASRLHLPFVAAAHRLHATQLAMAPTNAPTATTAGATAADGDVSEAPNEDLSSSEVDETANLGFEPELGCVEADRALDLQLRINAVARGASLEQGASLLRLLPVWAGVWGASAREFDHLKEGYGHLPIVFGAAAASIGVHLQQAVEAYQYTVARDLINSAVRMNLIGPTVGVELLGWAVEHAGVDEGLEVASVPELLEMATGCDALIDTLQANHGELYSRLFRS